MKNCVVVICVVLLTLFNSINSLPGNCSGPQMKSGNTISKIVSNKCSRTATCQVNCKNLKEHFTCQKLSSPENKPTLDFSLLSKQAKSKELSKVDKKALSYYCTERRHEDKVKNNALSTVFRNVLSKWTSVTEADFLETKPLEDADHTFTAHIKSQKEKLLNIDLPHEHVLSILENLLTYRNALNDFKVLALQKSNVLENVDEELENYETTLSKSQQLDKNSLSVFKALKNQISTGFKKHLKTMEPFCDCLDFYNFYKKYIQKNNHVTQEVKEQWSKRAYEIEKMALNKCGCTGAKEITTSTSTTFPWSTTKSTKVQSIKYIEDKFNDEE
eukprot:gene2699-3895_t